MTFQTDLWMVIILLFKDIGTALALHPRDTFSKMAKHFLFIPNEAPNLHKTEIFATNTDCLL